MAKGKKKYDSLAKRVAKAAGREELKAMKHAKIDAESGSLGAALASFIKKLGDERGDVAPDHSVAVAEYLSPYLDRLAKTERGLIPFGPQSTLPWHDIEATVLDVNDNRSLKSIAGAEGVSTELMYEMSKKRKWKPRRAILQELHARRTTVMALSDTTQILAGKKPGSELSIKDLKDETQFKEIVGECISVFRECMKAGIVEFKSAKDIDVLIRLMHFVEGKADKIEERRHRITVEDLQKIAAVSAKRHNWSPEMAGVVSDADFTVIGGGDGDSDRPKA
ncbi:MAG TPA: hypothetical protein VFH61_06365 [Thermoleophilia bacterium]|nr:hypothetical protein [Thermoleophilia bacterium]